VFVLVPADGGTISIVVLGDPPPYVTTSTDQARRYSDGYHSEVEARQA
jgi:hypothetical protein